MIHDSTFLRKLNEIRELPTLPEIMDEVLAVVGSSDSSAADLAAVLLKDQALCSKVLKIANSAFFAQRREISNIGDAVVILGFDSISQLALATTVFEAFGSVRPLEKFNLYGFWTHSIAVASGRRKKRCSR